MSVKFFKINNEYRKFKIIELNYIYKNTYIDICKYYIV